MSNYNSRLSAASPKPYFKGEPGTAGFVRYRSLHAAVKQSIASPRQQTCSNSIINQKQDWVLLLFLLYPYIMAALEGGCIKIIISMWH